MAACLLVAQKRLTIDDDGNCAAIVDPAQQPPLRSTEHMVTFFGNGDVLSWKTFAGCYHRQSK